MSQDLKKKIREEYVRCAASPAYFMRKYCYIQHPKRGRIQFNLYPFQDKVLTLFQENPYSIVLKSRQLGISTLSAGYSLMIFHKDKNILCIATKQETAKNMVTKVKFMYDNLPTWLKEKQKPSEDNKLTLRLNNGSQIKATSASSDAGRSEAVSLLIIDVLHYLLLMVLETGFIKHGLQLKWVIIVFYLYVYLGKYILNETKIGETNKMQT